MKSLYSIQIESSDILTALGAALISGITPVLPVERSGNDAHIAVAGSEAEFENYLGELRAADISYLVDGEQD